MLCLKNSEVCLCVSEWLPKMSAKQAWGLTPSDRSSTPQLFRPLMYFYFAWKKVYAFGNWRVLGGDVFMFCREEVYEPMEWIPALSWGHVTFPFLSVRFRTFSCLPSILKWNLTEAFDDGLWRWIQCDGFWRWIESNMLGKRALEERNIVC